MNIRKMRKILYMLKTFRLENKHLIYLGITIMTLITSCSSKALYNTPSSCLLMPRHQYIMLYNKPKGDVITDSVINDTIREDYVSVNILKIKNERAQVEIEYSLSKNVIKGWIEKKYLGIYPVSTSLLLLYDSPRKGASVCDSIENAYWGNFLSVEKHKKGWLYIEYQGHQGWMSPNDQCDNPYSSCN